MAEIKTIAVAGASGRLGKPVLDALLASGKFEVTVLTREGSNASFPEPVRVIPVDYTSLEALTVAMSGQDAVVSLIGPSAIEAQIPLIEAAAAAKVNRFIPSEFTADIANTKTAALPVYKQQIRMQEIVRGKAESVPGFTYTQIRNGVFLDWGLEIGFQVDLRSENPPFFDGGDRPFSSTTLRTIGDAVVGVLGHLEETKNRAVYVHDIVTTQRHLLDFARKIAPDRRWEPVDVSTEEMEGQARDNYAKGRFDLQASMGFFCRSVFAEGHGGEFKQVDNEMLGLGMKGDADLEVILRGLLL
ncbi:hypothetical protein BJX99DRAFT_244275 [Aspergillus californicus]